MDEAGSKGRDGLLHPVHEVLDDNENLSSLVEDVAIDGSSLRVGDRVCVNEEVGTSRVVGEDSRSSNKEEPEEFKGPKKFDQENICDKLSEFEQGTSYNNSNNLVNEEVVETMVVIETENVNGEDMKFEAQDDELGLSLVSIMKVTKGVSETVEDSCVIDMKRYYENSQGERICRICYLASVQPSDATNADSATSSDLIQLGCACKDELGITHIRCAEAWFKLKGNRYMFLPNTSVCRSINNNNNNNIDVFF